MKKFRKTSIRKVYDSLHGISDDAVPFSNAVEIIAYCLIDGKVEQGSSFETNLYNDLVEQLRKIKADLSKRTMALIWLYLQIIGKPVERLLSIQDLWTFDRNDIEKAADFLILKNQFHLDRSALEMRELLSQHFTSEKNLAEWSKEILENVSYNL